MSHLQWFGDEVAKKLEEMVGTASLHLTASMMNYMVTETETPYPPVSDPRTPPHLRTGTLNDSFFIQSADGNMKHTLGNSAEYATYLELGTYKMEPRPFFMPAIQWCQANVKDLLSEVIVKQ